MAWLITISGFYSVVAHRCRHRVDAEHAHGDGCELHHPVDHA